MKIACRIRQDGETDPPGTGKSQKCRSMRERRNGQWVLRRAFAPEMRRVRAYPGPQTYLAGANIGSLALVGTKESRFSGSQRTALL